MSKLTGKWNEVFNEEFQKPYFKDLVSFINKEREQHNVYPPKKVLFDALQETPFEKVKVVILGQDPYHGKGQADGMAFSSGGKAPPSLQIIYDEIIRSHLGIPLGDGYNNAKLISWANQGVLLLNRVLSVREKTPKSHSDKGWETFTDRIIDILLAEKEVCVWMLWGNDAKEAIKGKTSKSGKHRLLTSVHPAAQLHNKNNRFVGNNHFIECNNFLRKNNVGPIEWNQVEDSPYWETYDEYCIWRDEKNEGRKNWCLDPVAQKFHELNGKKTRMDLIQHPI